ncbi:unnamed protein product, partial [Hermetia illucens]
KDEISLIPNANSTNVVVMMEMNANGRPKVYTESSAQEHKKDETYI